MSMEVIMQYRSVYVRFLLILILIQFSVPGLGTGGEKAVSLDVKFNIDSIKNIVTDPESILSDVEGFWNKDKAFRLSKFWHTINNVPIEMDKFKNNIKSLTESDPADREQNKYLQFSREVKARESDFMKRAIPHILSFLPENGLEMATTIYLTGFTAANCFMVHTQIVANVTDPKLCRSIDSILNLMIHETYHIGFGINMFCRTEEPAENGTQNFVLNVLHNEGMATYITYMANDIYPNRELEDYRMLDDPKEVRKSINRVNDIFSGIGKLPADEFRKLSWEEGVMKRGYYIAGAHMSRTIDQKKGRKALIDVIVKGPRAFVSLYNSIADQGWRVIEFPGPEKLSVYSLLFNYLQKGGAHGVARFRKELEMEAGKNKNKFQYRIDSLAYRLMYSDKTGDAVDVLKFALSLFPEKANLYDSLGEAYMKNGEKEKSISSYNRSIELDPGNENAVKMLEKLKKD